MEDQSVGESPNEISPEEPPVPSIIRSRKLLRLPKPKTFFMGFAILLSLSLAVSANLQAFMHTHTYTAQDILADGYLDQDFSLLNATADDTYFKVHESVRTVAIFYAAAADPKTILGSFSVPGAVVSDKYVMVTSEVLPPAGYVLVGTLMVSSEYDRDMKTETLVGIEAPSSKYQIVAFERPAEDTNDTPKLDVPSLALVRPDDLTGGNALLAVPSDILIQNTVLTPAPLRGSVVYAIKGTLAIIAVDVAVGQPIFALRDGVPEFVGIATAASEQGVIVTTADAIGQYLDFIKLGD
ncbi:MAG: hypothetical protein UU22_C0028G0015 [Parcubacteria group bacterium GW2011_GWA2_40_8]|nr:MAG: hypothetical protein UU22_C0028G0015 [Parcubacteria group bacterium GW2011_GWA2_40_8]